MNRKWIVVAAVTAATLGNGCLAFREITGQERGSSVSSSDRSSYDEADAEGERSSAGEAVDRAASATDRAAAAADRAAAVAARASRSAEKTEAGFHKSLHK